MNLWKSDWLYFFPFLGLQFNGQKESKWLHEGVQKGLEKGTSQEGETHLSPGKDRWEFLVLDTKTQGFILVWVRICFCRKVSWLCDRKPSDSDLFWFCKKGLTFDTHLSLRIPGIGYFKRYVQGFMLALASKSFWCKVLRFGNEEPSDIENLKHIKILDPLAERQRFGCFDMWPCNCKQTSSLRFPINLFAICICKP